MMARPMLARKVLDSTAPEWFGRHPRRIPDADYWRWRCCVIAAKKVTRGG